MKVKALKNHYDWDGKYVYKGTIYMVDIVYGDVIVRNGLCKKMELPKRRTKRKNKK